MIDTAIPDTIGEDNLINFDKRRKEFEVLAQVRAKFFFLFSELLLLSKFCLVITERYILRNVLLFCFTGTLVNQANCFFGTTSSRLSLVHTINLNTTAYSVYKTKGIFYIEKCLLLGSS